MAAARQSCDGQITYVCVAQVWTPVRFELTHTDAQCAVYRVRPAVCSDTVPD